MNEMELELTEMLRDRAARATATPPMGETLRRSKVRRTTNAAVALLSIVALIAVSVAGVQAFLGPDTRPSPELLRPVTTTDGPYGFTSEEGDYPTIASGRFRSAEWELTGTAAPSGDRVDLKLTITEGGRSVVVDDAVMEATDDTLMLRHVEASEHLGGAHLVYGATLEGVDSVEVGVSDGEDTLISAHRFTDYESQSSITADYFIAFVPGDSPGFVHARDALGVDLELETYGRVALAPHVVATGRVEGVDWSVEFAAVQKDRLCLVFANAENGSECFSRMQVEGAGPLLLATFERDDVLGVVAIISSEVGHVRLTRNGQAAAELDWLQPPNEDRSEWPLRLVAVGLPPGTHGTLQAVGGDGETVIAEERF